MHCDHNNDDAEVYRVDTHGVVGGDGAVLLLRARASPGPATTATARGAPGACTYNEGMLGWGCHIMSSLVRSLLLSLFMISNLCESSILQI